MKLIVDSGSTKADWRIISLSGKSILEFKTRGLNPVLYSEDYLLNEIYEVLQFIRKIDILMVLFYGAGCTETRDKNVMKSLLESVFVNAEVEVQSDILASVFATIGTANGVAVILGTGSNIAFSSNGVISETRSGNGYILGDEGSGAYLGKRLIQDFLNGNVPADVSKIIKNSGINRDVIIDRVYRKEKANLFLAQLAILIHDNIGMPYFQNLVATSFDDLIETYLLDVDNKKDLEIGVVGSVGFYFQNFLVTAFLKYGFNSPNVVKAPIDSLIQYHLSN